MNYPDTDVELEALINADNTFGDDDILRVGSIQEDFGQAAQRFNRVTVDLITSLRTLLRIPFLGPSEEVLFITLT